jgi:hypothetical protein
MIQHGIASAWGIGYAGLCTIRLLEGNSMIEYSIYDNSGKLYNEGSIILTQGIEISLEVLYEMIVSVAIDSASYAYAVLTLSNHQTLTITVDHYMEDERINPD